MSQFSEPAKGVIAITTAAVIWGFAPVFYGLLVTIPALDVAAHRILWSFVFFATILATQGRLGALAAAVTVKSQLGWTALAALMVSFNWFFFIYAIQQGRLTEASLGYYIYPLVSVALGYFLFRDRFPPAQWLAVALAALGVLILTFGLGIPPYISLVLAVSFSLYGVVKKHVITGPMVSVTAEVLLLLPLVILWIAFASGYRDLTMFQVFLLMLSGPLTGLPLILFSYAIARVRLSTVGLISYLKPTLQFLVAVLIFVEPITPWHIAAFTLIWAALAIYSGVAIRLERARLASNVATSGTI